MFALGTFAHRDAQRDTRPFPGLVIDDQVVDLRTHFGPQTTTGSLLNDWESSLLQLRALALRPPAESVPLGALRPLPPVEPTGQILCAGANYHKHVVEMTVAALRDQPGQHMTEAELLAEAEATA